MRHGLNKDLGFTEASRVENIRRVAEVARLMIDAGLIVPVSFISPFRGERRMARSLVQQGGFCCQRQAFKLSENLYELYRPSSRRGSNACRWNNTCTSPDQ